MSAFVMYVSNANLAGDMKGRPLFGRSPLFGVSVKSVALAPV